MLFISLVHGMHLGAFHEGYTIHTEKTFNLNAMAVAYDTYLTSGHDAFLIY